MKLRSFAAVAGLLVAGLFTVQATTVIPPTWEELVDRAETIFEGSVTDVRSEWTGEGAQRRIVSYVTFKVEDAVKGAPGATYTMRMLGGTVDGQTLEVSDSPKFKAGDRDIVFVENNGTQFIPLVGIMHGRFKVVQEKGTGRTIVAENNGSPVGDVSEFGKTDHDHKADEGKAALSVQDFKAAIKSTLATSEERQKNIR